MLELALDRADEPVPVRLIERIAKFRARQLTTRGAGTSRRKGGREGQVDRIRRICAALRKAAVNSFYDDAGSIGRRYRRQDEAGTPFCITVDGETMEQGTVTIRDRDTMEQTRLSQDAIVDWLRERIG